MANTIDPKKLGPVAGQKQIKSVSGQTPSISGALPKIEEEGLPADTVTISPEAKKQYLADMGKTGTFPSMSSLPEEDNYGQALYKMAKQNKDSKADKGERVKLLTKIVAEDEDRIAKINNGENETVKRFKEEKINSVKVEYGEDNEVSKKSIIGKINKQISENGTKIKEVTANIDKSETDLPNVENELRNLESASANSNDPSIYAADIMRANQNFYKLVAELGRLKELKKKLEGDKTALETEKTTKVGERETKIQNIENDAKREVPADEEFKALKSQLREPYEIRIAKCRKELEEIGGGTSIHGAGVKSFREAESGDLSNNCRSVSSYEEVLHMTGKEPVERPPDFPNFPHGGSQGNRGRWLWWLSNIARDNSQPISHRLYAAYLFKKEYKASYMDVSQTEASANQQKGEMEQVKIWADGVTIGGFSDLVKAEEIFLSKKPLPPQEALVALGYFAKGSFKSILALAPGTIIGVAGRGGSYLFKVVGKVKVGKVFKPILQFVRKAADVLDSAQGLVKCAGTHLSRLAPKAAKEALTNFLTKNPEATQVFLEGLKNKCRGGQHSFIVEGKDGARYLFKVVGKALDDGKPVINFVKEVAVKNISKGARGNVIGKAFKYLDKFKTLTGKAKQHAEHVLGTHADIFGYEKGSVNNFSEIIKKMKGIINDPNTITIRGTWRGEADECVHFYSPRSNIVISVYKKTGEIASVTSGGGELQMYHLAETGAYGGGGR